MVQWCHFNGSGVISSAQLDDFADFFLSGYGSNIIALMSSSCAAETCQVALYETGEDLLLGNASAALSGVSEAEQMPASVAIAISWKTTRSYKGGHPRTYVPGVSRDHTSGVTNVYPAFASTLADAAGTFHTAIEGYTDTNITSVEHGTMSFVRDKAWRTPPVFVRFVTGSVDARLDSQRRRLGPDVIG